MNELFYFSTSDLLVRVDIDNTNNYARYSTHRQVSYSERKIIETYFIKNVLRENDILTTPTVDFLKVDFRLNGEYLKFKKQSSFPPKNNFGQKKNNFGQKQNVFSQNENNFEFEGNQNNLSNPQNFAEYLAQHDKAITEAVEEVCTAANKEYWFFRLGDILLDRNQNFADDPNYRLDDLIDAVNGYNKSVSKDMFINIANYIK